MTQSYVVMTYEDFQNHYDLGYANHLNSYRGKFPLTREEFKLFKGMSFKSIPLTNGQPAGFLLYKSLYYDTVWLGWAYRGVNYKNLSLVFDYIQEVHLKEDIIFNFDIFQKLDNMRG